ncbi:MAG: ABC transporter permease [Desulfobacterales bacterium]|nr:ABC transporter permease [Desulfobacterales bacterium]MDJ0912389.1 ABC transporter permease [Desulfobacterales bacterium]
MSSSGELLFEQPSQDNLQVIFSGSWKLGEPLPSADDVRQKIESAGPIRQITFNTEKLGDWDSGLLTFLRKLWKYCSKSDIAVDSSGLPGGVRQLLELAAAVPEKKDARKSEGRMTFLSYLGDQTVLFFNGASELLAFIGEAVVAFLRLFQGKAQYRRTDLWLVMEACSGLALPIVALISFLVGMILAFIGAIQLALFGAEIYVADLVGIAMVRLMAAIMTGIVMAGRTGGAFAAQLGTMQVNQEIDALKTLGLSPIEFLVLPRMLALALLMPLLSLFANVMGILGGAVATITLPDVNIIQYFDQLVGAVSLWDLWIGIFSSAIFGVIVAVAGCMRGMQCGRSASAVGDAATSAVVTAIVGIIVATAIITIMTNVLGI